MQTPSANIASFKLKRLQVKVPRITHLYMSITNIRDQIPVKRCAVRLERCNLQQLMHLNNVHQGAVIPANLYNGQKLKRLCVRVPRINCGARSDVSSRSTSVINSENENTDIQESV